MFFHNFYELNLTTTLCSELRGRDCYETFRYKSWELQDCCDEVMKKYIIEYQN